jgi:hypothetical protein
MIKTRPMTRKKSNLSAAQMKMSIGIKEVVPFSGTEWRLG